MASTMEAGLEDYKEKETENETASTHRRVRVHGAPARITWRDCDSGESRSIRHSAQGHVLFDVRHDTCSNSALFQVRAGLLLKSQPNRTTAYLRIHPERVRSVTVVAQNEPETGSSAKLSDGTHCLEFKLRRPPILVVPHGDLTARKSSSGVPLHSMRALAEQTTFTVHFPDTTVNNAQLEALSTAASLGSLSSMDELMDMASLYAGKGGRVFESEPKAAVVDQDAMVSAEPQEGLPPSYDESGVEQDFTSPYVANESGHKRRRTSSIAEGSATNSACKRVALDFHTMCNALLERLDQSLGQLNSRLSRMEDRMSRMEDVICRKEDHVEKRVQSCVQEAEARILEQVDMRIDNQAVEQAMDVDRSLAALQSEITGDTISRVEEVEDKVEDEFYGLRLRLEEYVKEEVISAEERIVEHIQNRARISLEFVG